MNYAFMSFSCPHATLETIAERAGALGYKGFEPRVESQHAHGIELGMPSEQIETAKALFQTSGVELCCLALGTRYVNPNTSAENLEQTLRYLDMAVELAVPRLRVFGGNLPDGMSREQAHDLLVTALSQLAPEATARGVTICLETHDGWCNPQHVSKVMEAVNSPAIAVNWDIMHPVRAGGMTMTEAFEVLKPWIKHVHVHDGLTTMDTLTMLPMGTGELDNKTALRLLKNMHYDGFVSGEWIQSTMTPDFFENHLESEITVLKRYEQDL